MHVEQNGDAGVVLLVMSGAVGDDGAGVTTGVVRMTVRVIWREMRKLNATT